MAPHGKEMTADVKEIILRLSKKGYSHTKISELTGKNRRTISKYLQRCETSDDHENVVRRGRRKKTDDRHDRQLFRLVKSNRRQTLDDLTCRFNQQCSPNLSSRTVRRRLFDEGYKRRRVSKVTTISKVNREKRIKFCREKFEWTVDENWKKSYL